MYPALKEIKAMIKLLNLILIKILIDFLIKKLSKSKKFLILKSIFILLKLAFIDI